MACNNEAKRVFDWFGYQLPHAIEHYLNDGIPSKTAHTLRGMLDDMPKSDDKEWLIRVLDCDDCVSVKDDKHGNSRYVIPMKYFMKGSAVNEKFVRSMTEGVFKKYNGWSGEYLVARASSRYELLAKVIMVLGRE